MRFSPALALVAAFLASSAVGALSLPQAGLEKASAGGKLHRRACKAGGHHKRHHKDDNSSASQPWPAPAQDNNAPSQDNSAAAPQLWGSPDGSQHTDDGKNGAAAAPAVGNDGSQPPKKHNKKKRHGNCALKHKHKGQDAGAQNPGGDQPPVSVLPGAGQGGDAGQGAGAGQGGVQPGDNGAKQDQEPDAGSNGQQLPPSTGAGNQSGSDQTGHRQQDGSYPPISGAPDGSSGPEGYFPGQQPKDGQDQTGYGSVGSSDQDNNEDQSGHGTSPTSGSNQYSGLQGKGLLCKGMRGSTTLPRNGKVKYDWFHHDLIHHGQGTQFGDAGLWKGGACGYDDMPHHNIPSIAMDQTFYQDGLACGSCVAIASTSASLFSNSETFPLEMPHKGTLPAGHITYAIVSDLCPGVDQCKSGIDMHLDAWNSVTHNAGGSKLPVNWKFTSCKHVFKGSGLEKLQIHWRSGASPGFFQVQVRGSHEAVVRVEMKYGHKGWLESTHLDHTYWKFDLKGDTQNFDQHSTAVTFRLTDWQGETITSEVSTLMGQDLFFDANFDRVDEDQE